MAEKTKETPTPETMGIFEAFFRSQSEFGIIPATAKNSYYKRADGTPSVYASLADIERTIRPILSKYGLFYIQRPEMLEGSSGVRMTTDIMNLKGEKIEGFPIDIPTAKKDSQGVGSAITYARRYSLIVSFGLSTEEEEDDGNNSSDLSRNATVPSVKVPTPMTSKNTPSVAPVAPTPAVPPEEKVGEELALALHNLTTTVGEGSSEKVIRDRFVQIAKLYGFDFPNLPEKLYDVIILLPISVGEKMKTYFETQLKKLQTPAPKTETEKPVTE